MYLEHSPYTTSFPGLRKTDLIIFGHEFRELILATVPTAKEIIFITRENLDSIKGSLPETKQKRDLENAFSRKEPLRLQPDKLLLPLESTDNSELAILVEGIDELVMEKSSNQWLNETLVTLAEQFVEVRNGHLDLVTSLANAASLKVYLSRTVLQQNLHLLLVESLSPARSVKDAFQHTAETARLLEDFNRFSFPLFHLGQSVFCFVIARRDKEQAKNLCHSLTNFARNAGLKRIHIGLSSFNEKRHRSGPTVQPSSALIDEAWNALHQAGRRGPYSFCDYELQVSPELFPLRTTPITTARKLSYRWKDLHRFSLVYMKPDFLDRKSLDPTMKVHLDKEIVVVDEDGYFVLRPGKKSGPTEKWTSSLINKVITQMGERYSLSAGVSSYPFKDYTKPEIARNCMKALLHGTFFGPGSCVVFDSLSLNVSGDAYFGESDLSNAVREYRKGLELAPDDVNLLNSLGVAYALMNMTGQAFDAFNRVLDIDPDNFMALFNKGLGEKKLKAYEQAVDSFTSALKVYDRNDEDETATIDELRFQLGVCQFHIGEYQPSIKTLKQWHRSRKEEKDGARCCRYIGIGYYHLGKMKDSATWLQRALVANQSDGEALSLLGTVYLNSGEGDDIALNLCARSVELEPENGEYKIRYAIALAKAQKYDQSLEILSTCTRSRNFRGDAWLEIARIALLKEEWRMCDRQLQKIFRSNNSTPHLLDQAKKLQAILAEKRA